MDVRLTFNLSALKRTHVFIEDAAMFNETFQLISPSAVDGGPKCPVLDKSHFEKE